MTAQDLSRFQWVSDPQIAPDGHAVAFVQSRVNDVSSGYDNSIYVLNLKESGGQAHLLDTGLTSFSPRWSPDSKQIAFLRSVKGDDGAQHNQLFLKSVDGSPSLQASNLPRGISKFEWRSDGKAFAALAQITIDSPIDQAVQKSDMRTVTRSQYRSNGAGFLNPDVVDQLFLIGVPQRDGDKETPKRLTFTHYSVANFTFKPNSGWLIYTSVEEDEPCSQPVTKTALLAIQTIAPNASPTQIAVLPLEIDALSVSPNGAAIAMQARQPPLPPQKPLSHVETDLIVQDLAWGANGQGAPAITRTFRNLTAGRGYEIGTGVNDDDQGPKGYTTATPLWSAHSTSVYDEADLDGSGFLVSIDTVTNAAPKQLSAAKQVLLAFAGNSNVSRAPAIVALITNTTRIGDLYRIESDGRQEQLTNVNEELFSQLSLRDPINLKVKATYDPAAISNKPIDTFVQLPPDYVEGKRYPVILNIHGGPHSAYGWNFNFEMQEQAAKGYVVIYPNPRGSVTYGMQFANAIQDQFPSSDYQDLMDAVDAAVRGGYADPNRLGVTGGSGGGLLTDWIATHTNGFKAAVAQRDIVDQTTWWYTTDLCLFNPFWMPGPPFEHEELYRSESPITFINRLRTPMLFIFSEEDSRTPSEAGGMAFYRYLKYRHIPTGMIFFPGENHALSATGRPQHRIERLDAITGWFDRFLKSTPPHA